MSTNNARHPHSGNRAARSQKEFVRAYMACEPCRRTKAKCEVPNPEAPCVKCNRERRECYFDTERSTKRRRKNGSGDRDGVNTLQGSRLLTQTSESANNPQSTSAPVRAQSHQPPQSGHDDPNRTGTVDRSSTVRSSSQTIVPTTRSDPRQDVPQTRNQPNTAIDGDMMRTYLSSSRDALGVLFQVAEQHDDSEDIVEQHESHQTMAVHDSPASAYTSGAIPAPVPPSKLSSPARTVLEVWDACRFVKQGWLSAREAVTYVDLLVSELRYPLTTNKSRFFANLIHFSPILDMRYSKHENHKSLIYEEPLLCCTLLMVSSRHHVLPGPGGASRAHFIHTRLWTHCEHLIKRLTFGQEKYSIAKTRTLSSIQSLLLITEWHPRSLHFPPESDGWDSSLAANNDDSYYSSKHNEDTYLIRWREEVFEPAKRSDRMSWMLLGTANTLAHELGVWANNSGEASEVSKDVQNLKFEVRQLLFIYVNQLASRIGCSSFVNQAESQSLTHTPDHSRTEKDRQFLMSQWIAITKLLKNVTEMIFPSKIFTSELLATGRYVSFIEHFKPLIERWYEGFSGFQSSTVSNTSKQILLLDYQYVRMYIYSLAVQAIVDRLKSKDGSSTGIDYDFLEVENSQDYKYVQEVTDASGEILQTTIGLADAGILRYAPVRVFLRITSASIFLLKALSLGARNAKLHKSLDVLDHCIRALRASTLDDIHLSSRYGMLIERHVRRFRQNFRVQPRAIAGNTRAQTPFQPSSMPFSGANGPTADNGTADSNDFSSLYPSQRPMDDLILDDDWLAQPFDPLVAPFGMGPHQTASGFEMDSLDFLWNIGT